jgi:hypothetical protein
LQPAGRVSYQSAGAVEFSFISDRKSLAGVSSSATPVKCFPASCRESYLSFIRIMNDQSAPLNFMENNEMIHVPVENARERKRFQVFRL